MSTLQAIINQAADDLRDFAGTKEDEILTAWESVKSEAELTQSSPRFALTFAIVLVGKQMTTSLAWSVRTKVQEERPIPDPDQAKLDLKECSE